jgi:hypothetical protein
MMSLTQRLDKNFKSSGKKLVRLEAQNVSTGDEEEGGLRLHWDDEPFQLGVVSLNLASIALGW